MAELILKIATKTEGSNPLEHAQQPTGACAPSSIYLFCHPTARFRCVIAAPV
jgi:hypothetical protein